MDIGGDKKLSYLAMPEEQNSFLGYRAIRFCLGHPDISKTQFRAILRASAFGDLRIMFPMISGIDQFRRAKQLLQLCKKELASGHIVFNDDIKTSMMVEIPLVAATNLSTVHTENCLPF